MDYPFSPWKTTPLMSWLLLLQSDYLSPLPANAALRTDLPATPKIPYIFTTPPAPPPLPPTRPREPPPRLQCWIEVNNFPFVGGRATINLAPAAVYVSSPYNPPTTMIIPLNCLVILASLVSSDSKSSWTQNSEDLTMNYPEYLDKDSFFVGE